MPLDEQPSCQSDSSEISADSHRIRAALERQGLKIRRFHIEHDSPHRLEDWDWNQRDLAHVRLVHSAFDAIPVTLEHDWVSAVFVQRILGFRVPVLEACRNTSPGQRSYAATLGPYFLLVEASLRPLPHGGTRVRTEYTLGGVLPFHLLFPLIERMIRRNYARTFQEDEPLRARRTELRSWGYRFSDDEGASYLRSTKLEEMGVESPDLPAEDHHLHLDTLRPGEQVYLGRSDHLGLRIVRKANQLFVYPRLCPHAGACLDEASSSAESELRCPWHGRSIAAIARFDLDDASRQRAVSPHYELIFEGLELKITARQPAREHPRPLPVAL